MNIEKDLNLKRQGKATEEMLEPIQNKQKEIAHMLSYEAYKNVPDEPPITEESFSLNESIDADSTHIREKGKSFVVIASDKEKGITVHEERFKTIEEGIKDAGFN